MVGEMRREERKVERWVGWVVERGVRVSIIRRVSGEGVSGGFGEVR